MTLNTVKPRSAIRRLSPSMVSGTDLLLGLVMTPSEDCVLSGIRLPFAGGLHRHRQDPLTMPPRRSYLSVARPGSSRRMVAGRAGHEGLALSQNAWTSG